MGPHNLINLFTLSVAVLIDWPDQILSFRRNFFLNKKFKSFNESVSQAIGIPKASNKLPQFISISAKQLTGFNISQISILKYSQYN